MKPAVSLAVLVATSLADGQVLSPEKEAAMGRQFAAEVRRHAAPLNVPEAQEWLDELGRQLATGFRAGIPWSFELTVDESATEPLSLPGGYVFVPAGAILASPDASAFMRSLAHQMAHAANPNSLKPMRAAGASIPLVYMGGWLGHHHKLLVPKAMTDGSEQLERQAEAMAAEAIAKAGDVPAGDFTLIQQLVRGRPKSGRPAPTLHRK